MISPLSYATDGYIAKRIKRSLVIVVAGLIVVSVPLPSVSGGGVFISNEIRTFVDVKRKIQRDDDEVFSIIKIFIQCRE